MTKPPVESAPEKAPIETVLQVTELTKQFGETHAVDHISLSVPAGSIFGIVGPNGAGKTTTLSMVTGLLRPDSGSISVHGADVWSDPVKAKRNMGVLPDRLRAHEQAL
ncbi:MAG: ATP-binding cassette domain-containing protein, partial [Actinomycetota bacterium]